MNIPDSYWSAGPPTKPGWYAWRYDKFSKPELRPVWEEHGVMYSSVLAPVTDFGGLWCRLVPAQEVEKAYDEGFDHAGYDGILGHDWQSSRALKVMEGEV